MVTEEEFGSLVAEYEGFRDVMLDELTKLRSEIENINEDIKEIKKALESGSDSSDGRQRLLLRR